jgi:hypothetical protein
MKNRSSRILQSSALSLFLFFTSLYYLFNAGDSKWGDETYMIMVARKIVTEGQIGFPEKEIITIDFWDHFASKGPDSLYYMKWGLGQSLVEVPFLFLHRVLFSAPGPGNLPEDQTRFYLIELAFLMLCPSMISAVGCVLFFLLALRLGFSRRISVLLTLVYGLATMVWPYSKSFMSETSLNVAILGGVYGAVCYVHEKRKRWISFSGACMGFAVLTKVTALLAVPLIAGYILGSLGTRKSLLHLLLCFVPALAVFCGLQGWHNWIRYGAVWQAGYQAGSDALGFSTPVLVGLWGLLLSPGKSFFLYAPVTILAFFCFRSFLRHRRNEALLCLGISVLFVLFHACWWSWAGDWAWGPRFLLVITPYMLLPCGMLLEKWKGLKRFHRFLALSLILLSVGIQFLGVTVHPFSYIEVRGQVLDRLTVPDLDVLGYKRFYTESALAQFSPLFSHIAGNWWLAKHMVFSYDLWSDAPWKSLGPFDLKPPLWVIGDRAIPFWWPIGLPLFSARTEGWVYPLAAVCALMLLLGAIRVGRLLRRTGVSA